MHPLTHRQFPKSSGLSIPLYGLGVRILWLFIFVLTLCLELLPAPGIAPGMFYLRLALKAACFVLLGFATPLAIWRFDSLGIGMFFALVATAFTELSQYMIAGHSTSLLECGTKVVLIFSGLALGLNCRYEKRLGVRGVGVVLNDPHTH